MSIGPDRVSAARTSYEVRTDQMPVVSGTLARICRSMRTTASAPDSAADRGIVASHRQVIWVRAGFSETSDRTSGSPSRGSNSLPGLADEVGQLGEDDLAHRQLHRRAGAGHDQDDGGPHEPADRPAQQAGRADLGVAEHPEELAEAGQGLAQERGDRLVRLVARADPGPPRHEDGVQVVPGSERLAGADASRRARRGRSRARRPDGPPPRPSSTIKAPEVSVSTVRVSETVTTARFSDVGAAARCSATAWLMADSPVVFPRANPPLHQMGRPV